jgi:Tfp pilus assembly protein PilF
MHHQSQSHDENRLLGILQASSNSRALMKRLVGLIVLTVCGSIYVTHCTAQPQSQQRSATFESFEAERLEEYLIEHQLDLLLIEHLESRLEKTLNRDQRKQLAGRLGQLYSQQLILIHPDGKAETSRWQGKADRLVELFPDLNSDALRVAALHARYLELEKQFQEIWKQGADPDALNTLIQPWGVLSSDLESTIGVLSEKSESRFAVQQADNESSSTIANEVATLESQILHCHYLNGWTKYFRAAVSEVDRRTWIQQAESEFRQFLEVDEKQPLNRLNSRWFDFASPWTVRAVVGLASTVALRDADQSSEHLFSLIENQSVDRKSQDDVPFWQLNNFCFFRKFDQAVAIADKTAQRNDLSERSLTRFWLAAFESAQVAEKDNPLLGRVLMKRSLAGLTRQTQGSILVELARENESAFELSALEFNDFWIKGYLEFYKSQNEGDASSIDSAKSLLERAIQIEPDLAFKDDWARCAYLLAWIHLRREDLPSASRQFQQVADLLESRDRKLAAESQWLAIECLVRLGRSDERRTNEAFAAIDKMLRRFPESKLVKRAEFEKVRLGIQTVPAKQAIVRLEQFKRGNPNYALAKSEIVGLRYRRWLEAQQENDVGANVLFREFESSKESLIDDALVSTELKLKAQLLSIDGLIRSQPGKQAKLAAAMSTAKRFADLVSSQSKIHVEFNYYQFLYAQQLGEIEQANDRANWLVRFGEGTKFETSALIFLAQRMDKKPTQQLQNDPEARQAAINIYQRLTEKLGQNVKALRSSGNARVALARLADLKRLDGALAESDRYYGSLLECFPDNASYLRQSARLKQEMGNWNEANSMWSRLSKGVKAGSDLWFESKSELIAGLAKSDPDAARGLFQQTMQLSGEIPGGWRSRFDELRVQLKIE